MLGRKKGRGKRKEVGRCTDLLRREREGGKYSNSYNSKQRTRGGKRKEGNCYLHSFAKKSEPLRGGKRKKKKIQRRLY